VPPFPPPLPSLWPYAETPTHLLRQVLGDLVVLVWCVFWWRTADQVRDRILGLQGAGARAESAGTGISERLRSAGDSINGLPLVGKTLAPKLRSAADAGNDLADAGRSAQDAVHTTASVLHTVALAALVGVVLAWWLTRRGRWVMTVRAARRLRATPQGLQLLGLRAAGTAPLGAVATVLGTHDSAGGLDPETLQVLGRLQLHRLGLRQPPITPAGSGHSGEWAHHAT